MDPPAFGMSVPRTLVGPARQRTDIMPNKRKEARSDNLNFLTTWLGSATEVVHHIGCTRGLHAAYYSPEHAEPWPTESVHCLQRDTAGIVVYLRRRHRLEVAEPFERIAQSAATWMTKRDAIEAFATVKHTDTDAAVAAMHQLARVTDEGLPDQKRLNLDLRIAEGAVWRASFPLLADQFAHEKPFIIRGNLIRWAIWVRDAFADAIHDWPDESDDPDGWTENKERWQLANIVFPSNIPNTDETPEKLAIEEARRAGDFAVALPRIEALMKTLSAFVTQAARWPQGNHRPALTEQLCGAINDLERLVGSEEAGKGTTDDGGAKPEAAGRKPRRHSPDFRSVHWDGTDHAFTANQAAIVKQLWEAYENGTPDVGGDTLLVGADADTKQIKDVFKKHPAWRSMIVEGSTKGTYRLAPKPA